jgi:hypothetical protein
MFTISRSCILTPIENIIGCFPLKSMWLLLVMLERLLLNLQLQSGVHSIMLTAYVPEELMPRELTIMVE